MPAQKYREPLPLPALDKLLLRVRDLEDENASLRTKLLAAHAEAKAIAALTKSIHRHLSRMLT